MSKQWKNPTSIPTAIEHSGWLDKAGGASGTKKEKTRFFTMGASDGDGVMAYFDLDKAKGEGLEEATLKRCKGAIPIEADTTITVADADDCAFSIHTPSCEEKSFMLRAPNELSRKAWVSHAKVMQTYQSSKADAQSRFEASVNILEMETEGVLETLKASQELLGGMYDRAMEKLAEYNLELQRRFVDAHEAEQEKTISATHWSRMKSKDEVMAQARRDTPLVEHCCASIAQTRGDLQSGVTAMLEELEAPFATAAALSSGELEQMQTSAVFLQVQLKKLNRGKRARDVVEGVKAQGDAALLAAKVEFDETVEGHDNRKHRMMKTLDAEDLEHVVVLAYASFNPPGAAFPLDGETQRELSSALVAKLNEKVPENGLDWDGFATWFRRSYAPFIVRKTEEVGADVEQDA